MSEVSSLTQPIISLTPAAAEEIKALLTKQGDEQVNCFRVYVESGGCSGLQYGMVFDPQRDNDQVIDMLGVRILVDPFSADYIRGAQVDFSDDLNDSGFKIINPNAKQSCGCGKSFET